jgi:SAM-dependent methyltransferase
MSAAPVPGGSAPPRDRTEMTGRTGETWRPPKFSPPGKQPFIDVLRRFVDLQAGSIWRDLAGQLPQVRGNVLDVGCGAQPYRELFPARASYRGIDTADAKANFGYDVPDTTYFDGDIWPVADQTIDFILCTETLEHVPDPRKLLAEAARCLKPGGKILLTTPFSARWHFIPHDYWRYTPSSLSILLSETGFVRTEVYARGNAVTVACYKAMALVLRLLLPQGFGFVGTWTLRLLSLPLIPCFVFFAVAANVSLLGSGGDDCLGYTAMAVRG